MPARNSYASLAPDRHRQPRRAELVRQTMERKQWKIGIQRVITGTNPHRFLAAYHTAWMANSVERFIEREGNLDSQVGDPVLGQDSHDELPEPRIVAARASSMAIADRHACIFRGKLFA